jgi:hypothetical protein
MANLYHTQRLSQSCPNLSQNFRSTSQKASFDEPMTLIESAFKSDSSSSRRQNFYKWQYELETRNANKFKNLDLKRKSVNGSFGIDAELIRSKPYHNDES